ncbi:hypothetical protein GC105_06880 [Alkalibaculum sp. M08DMB]|uniref:Uncharacterized protein n=1 Tax=Alkalibaculum sporogenes TaxID=2655001 RepID=A0A6A7K7P9_9FIRM|nr:hypothetical protein [Alkalibaculum sporogenes]MPW25509.1 hypothetical protein [Alkalibaculum sporogenes]
MTYTELVSKDLNTKMSELMAERKRIEKGIDETLVKIKERGSSNNGLAEIVGDLREKEIIIKREIEIASSKYAVDLNLLSMANTIDRADSENKGVDLLFSIGPKVNEIIGILSEIEKCTK